MGKTTGLLLAGLLAAFVGCTTSRTATPYATATHSATATPVATAQPPNMQENKIDASLQASIEREIRKHDPWVEWYIESDYTNDQKESHVSLRILPIGAYEIYLKDGGLPISGAYHSGLDFLILLQPSTEDGESVDAMVDAIDHELLHGLFDDRNTKGILHDPDYIGPTLQEISDYAAKRTSGPEFSALREQIDTRKEFEGFKGIFKSLISTFEKSHITALQIHLKTLDYIDENPELEDFIFDDEKKVISSQRNYVFQNLKNNQEIISEMADWMSDWFSPIISDKEEFTSEYVRAGKDKLKEFGEEFEKYGDVLQQTRDFSDKVRRIYGQAEYTKSGKKIGKSKNFSDPSSSSDSVTRDSTISRLVYQSNIHQLDKILNDPNEVMARVVDSLYSVYFGPVTQNKFPLTEQDLDFLAGFKVKRNGMVIPLFAKGIEKYRVGMEMIEEGHRPEAVKRQLEHSNYFAFKGRIYHWPEANFKIKGNIPYFVPIIETPLLRP